MDNVKTDSYYIEKIRKDLEFIVDHMQNVDIEELNANEVLLDSMMFRIIGFIRGINLKHNLNNRMIIEL